LKLSFFHNKKIQAWINKRNRGFSLLELLVVILIALILSTVTLLNFPLFSARQSLQVSAEEIAQTIREAQIYGISIKAADGSINPAPHYGIFVSAANTAITNPIYTNKIILFVDKNDSGQYDAGTGVCGSATTECTKEILVKDPNLIFTLCYNQTGLPIDILKPDTADKGYLCGNSTYEAIKTVTVLFKRPNTEPEIKVVSTRGSIITPINYVKIVISGPDTVQKSIYISRIGQIAVNNFGRPPAPVGCPAIFTWNGTSFVFEHEAVPFAYTKFFEGTSFKALQNSYLENNILRLRVAEEKNEISFIDQVGVLAVDAPRGSGTVFPGEDGKLYVVKDEEKPLSCLLGEVSCTEEAQAEDNVPFALGATVNDTGQVSNNEAIFTFKKPEVSHARLLILAKANPLAEQSAFLYGALAKPAFSVAEFLSPISTSPKFLTATSCHWPSFFISIAIL
jgi:prepilin-type N-terminal cleavage/methylation domain-containing protein